MEEKKKLTMGKLPEITSVEFKESFSCCVGDIQLLQGTLPEKIDPLILQARGIIIKCNTGVRVCLYHENWNLAFHLDSITGNIEMFAYIDAISVINAHTGTGIGRRLIGFMEDVGSKAGGKMLTIHRVFNKKFWTTMGYLNSGSDTFYKKYN